MAPVRALVAIVILLRELVAWIGRPLWRWFARLELLQALERFAGSLPPWGVLALLAVPVIISEPMKIGGLYLIATGCIATGLTINIAGHAFSLLLVERILHSGRPALMRLRWVAVTWTWFDALRARVLAWAWTLTAVRMALALGRRMSRRIRRLFARSAPP